MSSAERIKVKAFETATKADLFLLVFVSAYLHQRPPFRKIKAKWHISLFSKKNCDFCLKLQVEFFRLSQIYSDDCDLSFYLINCDDHLYFCRKYGVYGVPSLILANNNLSKTFKFKKERNLQEIVHFIYEKTGIEQLENYSMPIPVDLDLFLSISLSSLCQVAYIGNGDIPYDVYSYLDPISNYPNILHTFTKNQHDSNVILRFLGLLNYPTMILINFGGYIELRNYNLLETTVNDFCYNHIAFKKLNRYVIDLLRGEIPDPTFDLFRNANTTHMRNFANYLFHTGPDEVQEYLDQRRYECLHNVHSKDIKSEQYYQETLIIYGVAEVLRSYT